MIHLCKENCGNCFAAEQFVDVKLGVKDLLTLTSCKTKSGKLIFPWLTLAKWGKSYFSRNLSHYIL